MAEDYQTTNRYLRSRRAEIRRLLEAARGNVFETRALIEQVFDKDSAEILNNRLYRCRIEINNVKDLIKD